MAKRSTPKQQLAKSRGSRRYKSFVNKSQKKLSGTVDFMKKLQKSKSFQRVTQEGAEKKSEKITKIKA